MSLHMYLPSDPKLDQRVAELELGDHATLSTAHFTVLRYKENETHKAVINEILQSRLNDISNAVGKRLSRPSMQPEIMRNISGYITTKPGEIFAIVPAIPAPEAPQAATISLWKDKAETIAKPLAKGIHLVFEEVSFSVSDSADFCVLPFQYNH